MRSDNIALDNLPKRWPYVDAVNVAERGSTNTRIGILRGALGGFGYDMSRGFFNMELRSCCNDR